MPTGHDTATLKGRIVGLRRARASWADIATETGKSIRYVRDLYATALADTPVPEVDEHRAEELVLYDDCVAELLVLARDTNQSGRTRVDAYEAVRGWAERKAKLLGIDAPAKMVTLDWLDAEIARLSAELDRAAASEARAAAEPSPAP